MNENISPRHRISSTSIHIMALDGTLNVNSLFALAAFLGISLNPSDPNSTLITAAACAATSASGRHMVESHVYSFSAFLFSSLIASALKLAIRAGGGARAAVADGGGGRVNLRVLRAGIVASAAGSVLGCAFLTAALVELVQIKLGKVGCWGWHAAAAVAPLLILVPSALLIYVCLLFYAFIQ